MLLHAIIRLMKIHCNESSSYSDEESYVMVERLKYYSVHFIL